MNLKQLKTTILLGVLSTFMLQSQEIERLKHELTYAKSDTSKVWQYRDLAYYYQSQNSDSAIHFAYRGYDLAKFLQFPSGQIWCLYQVGRAYEIKDKLDSTFAIYNRALHIAKKHDDSLSRAKLLNAIGVTHYFSGNLHDALIYYSRGFSLSDSLAYKEGIAYALNNMAVIYRLQRRYEKALEIYDKSLEIKIAEKDTVGIINSLYNKGLALSYLNRHEESLSTFTESKFLSEKYQETDANIANIEIGIGVAHFNLGNIAEAKNHLKNGIQFSEKITPERVSAMAYLGSIDVQEGRTAEGLKLIEDAYELTVSSGRQELLRTVLKERALASEAANNYNLASESWKAYSIISDSLNQESSRWAMEEMQARFELKDKETTISLQQLQLEKEANQKRWYLISGIFLALVLLVIILFLRKILNQRKQLTLEVAKKEEALKENELLLQEMHHRTKNNLQLLNSILSLHSRNIDNPVAQKALQSSRDSVGAIGLLHHQLYKTKDLKKVNFQPYVNELCDYFRKAFSLEERKISLSCNCEDFSVDIEKAIPLGLIMNEMITNAIKHAFEGENSGAIQLNVKTEIGKIIIEVEDNGVGIKAATESSTGTGRKLIKIFSDKFKADFDYISKDKGTLARFSIPA
jgi:two-component sensor histidine kinase